MPEVIRPSGGDSLEGTTQAAVTASQLPVVIRPSDRSQPTGTGGTGFFISHDGSVMTVAHVVQSCKRIVVASRHLKETSAKLLAVDVRNDVALLLANNIRPPAVLALADRPYGAESLEIFGYPADGDTLTPTETHGLLRTDRPTFDGLDRLDRPEVLWMDANTVRPGFSGGPIVGPNGDVIGLINGHVMRHTLRGNVVVRDTKFVYGASTRTINDFLRHEVPALVPDAGRSPPPGETDKAIVRVLCLR
jgi:S1-C subfamily serine protease